MQQCHGFHICPHIISRRPFLHMGSMPCPQFPAMATIVDCPFLVHGIHNCLMDYFPHSPCMAIILSCLASIRASHFVRGLHTALPYCTYGTHAMHTASSMYACCAARWAARQQGTCQAGYACSTRLQDPPQTLPNRPHMQATVTHITVQIKYEI